MKKPTPRQNKKPLNDYEIKTLVPRVIQGLYSKHGLPAKSPEIVEALRKEGFKINDVKLREVIHYIRINHIVRGLASSPNLGYWIEQHPERLQEVCAELAGRIRSQQAAQTALQLDVLYFKQTKLPA